MSLRARLLAAVGTVALVALIAAGAITYTELKSLLYNRVDSDLLASAQHYDQILDSRYDNNGPGGGPNPDVPAQLPGGPSPNGINLYIGIVDPDGSAVSSTTEAYFNDRRYSPSIPRRITGFARDPDGTEAAYLTTASAQPGGPTFRVRAEEISSGIYQGDYLVVAEPIDDVSATLHDLLWVELAVFAGALVVAAALGWSLVKQGLRPLTAMERTAEAIAAGELDERVPGANDRTEVGRLASTLNVMLTRIQQAFAQRDATETELRRSEERLRQFVADASHELRTPIAAVSAYSELFERGASERPEDLQRVVHGIRSETSRMARLVEDLLLLARLDEGLPLASDAVELVAIAADAARTAETVGPEWPIRLVAAEPVETLGDAARLRQVLDNLLANVRAHTPVGTATTITVTSDGAAAMIQVADDGPGLTREQAQKVFERFYRVERSRSRVHGGAGLGLSIVASIVAAHGGKIRVTPGSSSGAVFTILLPLATPAAGSANGVSADLQLSAET